MDFKLKNKEEHYKNPDLLASTRHSRNINELEKEHLTFGEKLSDRLADFAGSWIFIILFLLAILFWIAINSFQLTTRLIDPFPYILLNLILSCIAAIQAPIIMMSQNRQEKKDRIRAEQDYEINLKAEILIEEIINRLKNLECGHDELKEIIREIRQDIEAYKK